MGFHNANDAFIMPFRRCNSSIVDISGARGLLSRRLRPGPAHFVVSTKRRNAVDIATGQIDIVPAVEQLTAADGIDAKGLDTIAARDRLRDEIDRDRQFRIAGDGRCEFGDLVFGKDRRQQSILHRILRKYVAE